MSEHKSDKSDRTQVLADRQQKSPALADRYDNNKTIIVSEQSAAQSKTVLSPISKSGPGIQSDKSTQVKDILEIGDTIKNRFILVKELGQGGMGVVYKARDLRKEEAQDRNPYVALKVLSEEFKNNPESFIALQRETRKTQELAHPNIVTVFDFDRDGRHVYMTMECLDGKPLSALLREKYFLSRSITERWSIIQQISSALAYAHKKKIIHLDLKPDNIYIRKDGTVKVLDFGIARVAKNVDKTETSTDATVFDAGTLGALTPTYASCEMLENQEPDFRDDIYALACVAYEILANKHPFNRLPATQARYNKITPAPIKEISKKQRKALLHGLAFNRKDRVATIDQFLQEAQLINSDSTGAGSIISWTWAAMFFTGVVVLVGALWFSNSQNFTGIEKQDLFEEPVPEPRISTPLTIIEQQKISRILEIAEMHFMIGRLIEPKGTNALDAYNQVLLIDPQNQKALAGIDKIVGYFEQEARELWDKGEKESSMEMLNKGLQASPKHKGLNKFQQLIEPAEY